jgi:flagellin-like hook-associated protein FlgL
MEGEALPADVTDKQLFDRILRRVQKGLDNVIERVVDSGSNQSKFENLTASVGAIGTAAEKRLSKLEDIDVAKAATDLSTVEASLQASLQLATKITDLSIVNYI